MEQTGGVTLQHVFEVEKRRHHSVLNEVWAESFSLPGKSFAEQPQQILSRLR